MSKSSRGGTSAHFLIIALVLMLGTTGWSQDPPTAGSPTWKAEKAARILAIVADLRSRDRPDLDDETRANRLGLLEALADYARSGAFPINDLYPGRLVPYFIDGGGRRCALAHLIEYSGEDDLLQRLAREMNNAYMSQVGEDEELSLWLARQGLSVDEVAYIQAPSIIDRRPIGPVGPYYPPGTGRSGPPNDGVPGGIGRNPPGGLPPRRAPAQGPGIPAARTSGDAIPGSGGGGRRKASSTTLDFDSWWRLQREALVDVRGRYQRHDGITPQGEATRADATLTPGADELAAIEKVFTGLRRDPALETAVLMALTEAPRDAQARESLAGEIIAMLGTTKARHREFAVLALGRSRADAALEPLVALLHDRPTGRRLAGASSRVPRELRAMAAFALAQLDRAEAAVALLDLLTEDGLDLDLHCSAVLALAQLGRNRIAIGKVLPRLVELAGDEKVPSPVRVQAMAALGIVGDRSALPVALDPLRRFRGSVELRRAAARSLAALGSGLERETFEVLAASGRRDPDAGTRQLAIAAIGEISGRDQDLGEDESEKRRELIDEVGGFLDDGVTQFFKQRIDRPFYAVAAGLHAGAHPGHRATVAASLLELLNEGKRDEDRAAAALGLGLSGSSEAREALRAIVGASRRPLLAGYAAEALGLLDDEASAETLLVMLREAGDDFVAYQATIGLALLGRVEIQPQLVEILRETRSEALRGALARALGQIGDRRSVGALLEIAGDKGRNLPLRLRAISALGLVLRPGGAPWSLPCRRGLDPSSFQPSPRLMSAIL